MLVLLLVGDVRTTFVAVEFDFFESESFKSGQFFVPHIFVTLFATLEPHGFTFLKAREANHSLTSYLIALSGILNDLGANLA